MKPVFRHLALSLGATLVLAACGGGGDGATDDWTGGNDTSTSTPTANAGPARAVLVGATVTLDGSGSSSGGLNYAWTLVSKPSSSTAELTRADTVNPTFVADVAGRYEVDLVVSNGQASSNHSRVVITAGSTVPVADGPSKIINALFDGWAQLDGSTSTPPAGGDEAGMVYTWKVTDPEGQAVQLLDAYSAKPGFVPKKTGLYLARLVVSYGRATSNEFVISVNVTKANTQPVANTGGKNGSYTGTIGQGVKLDGSASSDADNDALSYFWRLVPYPANGPATAHANVRIDNANTATPTFHADIAGTYRLELHVFDGTSRSYPQRAEVILQAPEHAQNTAPVAVIRDEYPLNEAEPLSSGTSAAYIYFYNDSYDKDGNALTAKWEWGDTPKGFYRPDLSARSSSAYFRPNDTGTGNGTVLPGYYTIYLTVNDGQADSQRVQQTIHVRPGANRRPSAKISVDTDNVMVGTEAWLDGTQSSDPDDGTVGMTYQWRWTNRPSGSKAELRAPTAARTSFVPDVPGAYEVELIVYDSVGTPSRRSEWTDYGKTAIVMVKSKNNPPVARFLSANPATFDEAQGIYRYTLLKDGGASLEGLACSFSNLNNNSDKLAWSNTQTQGDVEELAIKATAVDPDGDSLYYHLSVDSPSGSGLQPSYSSKISNATMGLKLCNLSVPGDYKFTLQVSDSAETTEVQRLVVRVEQPGSDVAALKLESLVGNTATDNEQVFGEQSGSSFNHVYRLDKSKGSVNIVPVQNDNTSRQRVYEQFQNGGTLKYLKLTAIGKDYTISNVQASVSQFIPRDGKTGAYYSETFDNAAAYQPRFEGLPSVIKAGESVVFKAILPAMPPQRATKPSHWDADRNFDSYVFNLSFTSPDIEKTATVGATIAIPIKGWNWGK